MIELFESANKLINEVSLDFKRYLFSGINWQARLIEINGARGVGKTTMMLQKAKLVNSEKANTAIYFTLDDPRFFSMSIIDIADEFSKYGGEYLFLDEVHKYPSKFKDYDWSAEIKNIYDMNPELHIVYSGSSVLKIYKGQGDLSRRRQIYYLAGLSLREYLEYNGLTDFNSYNLDEILNNHQRITEEITEKINILPHFRKYLDIGYYPFYKEAPEQYYIRLKEIISVILERDIPTVADISYETIMKIKKLLAVIANVVPYAPNLSKTGKELYITDQRTLLKYLYYLDIAELLILLSDEARGNQIFRKPDKIYLNNTNLLKCLELSPEKGTIRETFFINQLKYYHSITTPSKGDFMVDNKYLFEIGGKNKGGKQIKGKKNAWLALDDIETGFGNVIPLWLFGFLY
ncbi:ATP-binding protein [Bacteroidota bacterium]